MDPILLPIDFLGDIGILGDLGFLGALAAFSAIGILDAMAILPSDPSIPIMEPSILSLLCTVNPSAPGDERRSKANLKIDLFMLLSFQVRVRKFMTMRWRMHRFASQPSYVWLTC